MEDSAEDSFEPISHNTLQRVAVKELLNEGFSPDSIEMETALGSKKTDVCATAADQALTVVECKSFKHTSRYASENLKGGKIRRSIVCQPFFDVDEMWLVYRDRLHKYRVLKIQRPVD
ncbi:MAG: hypothetical protein QW767_02005 [Thermoprotei archaeon]